MYLFLLVFAHEDEVSAHYRGCFLNGVDLMTTAMSTSKSAARRAILQTSRVRWKTDQCEIVPIISSDTSKMFAC